MPSFHAAAMPGSCAVIIMPLYHAVIAEMPSSFCPRCHRPDNAEMLSSTATASTRTRDAPTTTQPLPLMLLSLSHALQPSLPTLSTITSTPGTHNPLLFSASLFVFSFQNPVPAHPFTSSTTSSTPPHSLSPQTHPLTSSLLQTPFATTSKPTARPSVQLLLHHLLFP